MNIKGRIKKLGKGTCGFCSCNKIPEVEIYLQDLTSDVGDNQLRPLSDAESDVCTRCGREVEKHKSIIQLID